MKFFEGIRYMLITMGLLAAAFLMTDALAKIFGSLFDGWGVWIELGISLLLVAIFAFLKYREANKGFRK